MEANVKSGDVVMKEMETELREAAARYAGCHVFQCGSPDCISYARLKLAMFRYMQKKFERIAASRAGKDVGPQLASSEAMFAVSSELELVIKELGLEHAMHGGIGANTPSSAEA